MKVKLTVLAIGSALAISGCSSTNTNSNTAANRAGGNANSAVVLNSNQAPITGNNTATGGTNTNTTSGNSNFNYNMSREEVNANRSNVEAEARRTGGSIGTGANDTWIWMKTRAALLGADDLRDSTINVDVADGVITLKGSVANQQQKASAAKVAQTIEGKKSVVNQLTVNPNASVLGTNANSGNTNQTGNANTKKP